MRLLWIVAAISIGCSNTNSKPPAQEQSINHTPAPQTVPCRATHEHPFRCVTQNKLNPKYSNYSLYIDRKSVPLEERAQIPQIPHNFFQLFLYSKFDQELKEAFRGNLFATEIDLTANFGYTAIQRHYWEPDPSRWPSIIERKSSPMPLANLSEFPWINRAWEQVLQKDGARSIEFFTRDGCAGHCIITIRHPSVSGYRIREINEYVGGLSIRHQVLIEEIGSKESGFEYAIIEIDPSDSPNLIYILGNNFVIMSRTGEVLSKAPQLSFRTKLSTELKIRDNHTTIGKSSVVICDAGALPSELTNFRVGPMTAHSFWGWISPEDPTHELSLWEQLSGVYALSDINYGYNHGPVSIADHHASVARLAIENINISTINMTAYQCFSHYKQWKDNVKPYSRVVSVSATFSYDFESCQNEPRFKDSIGDPEQPFLWVVAAGNDYQKNLIAPKTFYCPQSLGPQDNMIVVSSAWESYSNDGVNYSDIAADGYDNILRTAGTSVATPRVARVAAILAEEFPSLTNVQIKQAIMQGARIPTPRLANRSGGILNESGARRIAKQLVNR